MTVNEKASPVRGSYAQVYRPLVRFLLVGFTILTLSRVVFTAMYWDRIGISLLFPLFLGGLRIDLCLLGMLAALPATFSSFFSQSLRWRVWERRYYCAATFMLLFFELITPTFIEQYDTRPNRLFFEYLGYPEEVSRMLFRGFGTSVVLILLGLVLGVILLGKLLSAGRPVRMAFGKRFLGALLCGLLAFACIRGTIGHRPINPATVAFTSDRMLNTLPLNSTYSLFFALYRMKDERNAGALYGSMDEAEMHKVVRASAGIPDPAYDKNRPSLHASVASVKHESPPHVVIILEESLGARYVGHLDGDNLTPELDALAKEAWVLKNLYATGTRSARGIEAVVTGFLPTPARAVVKLGLAQNNFFTLAHLFNSKDYDSTFMYGGEAHFDNMRGFLLNNGFERVIDRKDFKDPVFAGTWGVSDEDMLNRLHTELETAKTPQFIFAFSVTNHSPYEYPEGRITPDPPAAATVGNAIRYADWAVGDFFRKAKASSYYKNTIFLVVADHDSRVYGASLIPVKHFHIPGMFLGGAIEARVDERLASQIDLPPTLVSMAGISTTHPMLGHDLSVLPSDDKGRAIMQYGDNFGYREGNRMIVLQPKLPATQYNLENGFTLVETEIDPDFAHTALAHALWPSWAYRNSRYSPAS